MGIDNIVEEYHRMNRFCDFIRKRPSPDDLVSYLTAEIRKKPDSSKAGIFAYFLRHPRRLMCAVRLQNSAYYYGSLDKAYAFVKYEGDSVTN